MDRLAAIIVVLLIGGTAAAFAYTQGLKQTKSPIVATQVKPHQFSPACECLQRSVRIGFGLRRSDHVTLSIVNGGGRVVRTLLDDQPVRHGYHSFTWNGYYADGRQAPDGVYHPRVDLSDADRTITMPSPIRIDTLPPRISGAAAHATKTLLRVRYLFSEQANALLFVGGRRVLLSLSHRPTGRVQVSLRSLHGAKTVSLVARDLAGNLSKPRLLKVPS